MAVCLIDISLKNLTFWNLHKKRLIISWIDYKILFLLTNSTDKRTNPYLRQTIILLQFTSPTAHTSILPTHTPGETSGAACCCGGWLQLRGQGPGLSVSGGRLQVEPAAARGGYGFQVLQGSKKNYCTSLLQAYSWVFYMI